MDDGVNVAVSPRSSANRRQSGHQKCLKRRERKDGSVEVDDLIENHPVPDSAAANPAEPCCRMPIAGTASDYGFSG